MEDPGPGILMPFPFRGFRAIFAPFSKEIAPPRGTRFLPIRAIPREGPPGVPPKREQALRVQNDGTYKAPTSMIPVPILRKAEDGAGHRQEGWNFFWFSVLPGVVP